MPTAREAAICLLVAVGVLISANIAGGWYQRTVHVVDALTRRPDRGEGLDAWRKKEREKARELSITGAHVEDAASIATEGAIPPEPLLMLVAASYGRRGIHPQVYNEVLFDGQSRTVRWWCEATSPVTWNIVLRHDHNLPKSIEHVVLLVSPNFTRYPSSIKDIALRHILPFDEISSVAATGQLLDASEMLVSRASPLYQGRRGGREKILTTVLRPLGIDNAHHLPQPVNFEWHDWTSDQVELEGLRDLVQWLRETGRGVTIAEWPMGSRLRPSVHAIVDEYFRPLMASLAQDTGAHWLPQPIEPIWDFVDAVHPDSQQGADISRWIAHALRKHYRLGDPPMPHFDPTREGTE